MKTRGATLRALAFGVLVAVTSLPATARASACCTSATAVGIGRLLPWERFALGVQTALVTTLGHHGADGRWYGASSGNDDYQWRSDVWGLFDLSHNLLLWADLPLMMNYRAVGPLGSGTGGGVGDVQAGLRWDAIAIGGLGARPGLAFTFTVTAPSGRTTADALRSADVRGTSVTGRGAWILSLGIVGEKATNQWFVRAGLGAVVPLPMDRPDGGDGWALFGPGVSASIVGGGRLHDRVVLSGYLRASWESALWIAGVQQPGSDILDPGLGLALSFRAEDHFTLQASVDTNLFVDALGKNHNGQVTASLGLRYGYF